MNLTQDDVEKYVAKFRKRGEETVNLLGKESDFIKALNSEVGKEILRDLVTLHEGLLMKVSDLKATDEEKMQYKVAKTMLLAWSRRIAAFENKIQEIKQFVQKGDVV